MIESNFSGNIFEAGCDEAGRGCVAGPVVAAAVMFPSGFQNRLINDSKQLTSKQRDVLRGVIESNALCYAVGIEDNNKIDYINILQASIAAMHSAIKKLAVVPEYLIIDGNKFNSYNGIPHTTIPKGDSKYLTIAAASIIAKCYRDKLMNELHNEFPVYGWDRNKGYPTKEHIGAIEKYGLTPYHRKSFRIKKLILARQI